MIIGTNPVTLNHEVTTNPSASTIQRMVENMLFVANAKQEPVPSLATSLRESKNGLTYSIYLRHGVHWSDGVLFTSKDVVFTLEKFMPLDAEIPPHLTQEITSVKPVGKYEVVVQLKQAYAPFSAILTDTLFILPEHVYGNQTVLKDSTANDHPIGTGPYIFKQWIPTQRVVLVRNPHYWGATKKDPLPYFSKVVVDIITNPQTIVDDLLSGAVDYVPTSFMPETGIKEIEHSSCCRAVAVHGSPSGDIMYTNTQRAPFNNLTVRRAIYMAITRKLIIKDALTGHGTLPLAQIPQTFGQLYTPKINLMKQYPYDPAKAAKMLDDAGFTVKNGERFGRAITLVYAPSLGTYTTNTVKIVKAELAAITIQINLVAEDLSSFGTQTYVKHDFTLAFIALASEADPALGVERGFACQPTETGKPKEFTNPTGFCNKEVTSLFHQADVATTTAGRRLAYEKAQRIIDDDLPSYEMGVRQTFVGVSKRVQNWQVSLLSWGGSFTTTWSESWF